MPDNDIHDKPYNRKLLLALFLHSLSIISFQIILMRILSVFQWDLFTNMIISIAMLGLGVSGTVLALTRQRLLIHSEKLIPLLMILSSLFMLIAYRLTQHEILKFDTNLVFGSAEQLLRLFLFLVLFFLPFFSASLAIGMIYVKYVSGIGKLYFSNLIGEGIGGIIGLLILFYFLPENALTVAAFFPLVAAIIIYPRKHKALFYPAFGILVIVISWNIIKPVSPSVFQNKSLAGIMQITATTTTTKDSNSSNDDLSLADPASDNNSNFSHTLKISKLRELIKEYNWQELPFAVRGYIIAWFTFIIALIFSAVLILLPVAWLKKSKGKISVLFYFGAIGIGFMFVEIILIQRFVLYLGQPVYAVSAVLSIMCLVSGIGSYFSSKFRPDTRKFYLIYIMIFMILIIYSLYLTAFLGYTAESNIVLRIFITSLIVGLPAFFMGMPFPLGLQTLSIKKHDDKLAWAYGIDGFFSVIATPMALIIAIEASSVLVISLAAVAYLTALLAIFIINKLNR
jgi:hypothetical protein